MSFTDSDAARRRAVLLSPEATSLSCPDESTLLAFLDGRLSQSALASVDAHLVACAACRDLVAAVAPVVLAEGSRIAVPAHVVALTAEPPGPSAPLARGATVGRYVILDLVGRGGMGDVYAAYDPELDRRIALKLLHGGAGGEERARSQARLLKEAKAIARLSHPSIVVVHDAGTIGDRVFIAMEFVEGRTLAAWLGGKPRPWAEIRALFLAAGRGLAAAHAARIVHRDFKPQNVMVTPDGSVRVMDFGLASESTGEGGEPEPAPAGAPEHADFSRAAPLALTRTGALLGTPAYMAPEQFLGQRADERTDQFAFCVSLYEALHGERPFPGDSVPALAASVTAGKVRDPNPRARPPTWLRKIVLRGLRAKREERFPTLATLLAALERDPVRRRRRVLLGIGLTAVLLAGGALAQRTLERTGASLCHGAGEKLAGVWEVAGAEADAPRPRHDAIRTAFLATGAPRAEETWKLAAGLLDGYARRWTGMYGEACEATHVRGEQSSEVLDLRMTCLESSRQSLRALGDVFASADVTVVREAVNAASALPELARCADVPVLRAVMPPPQAPDARRKVEALRTATAEVRALRDTGRWREGLRRLTPLVDEARALGYKPVLAEILSLLGWIHYWNADPKTAEKSYEEALWAAEASRHDQVSAEAAIQLTGMTAWELGRPGDSERWAHLAEAILQRMGTGQEGMGTGHALLEGWLAHNRALGWERAGRLEAAEAEFRRAVTLRQGALGPEHPDMATSINALSECLARRGRYAEAIETAQRARAVYDRAYGPGSAIAAIVLSNSAESLSALGRQTEALATFRKALGEAEAAVGPDHVWLGYPLVGTGLALLALGRPAEAIAPIERSIFIRDRAEPRFDLRAESRFALARALWDGGGDRARARLAAETARAEYAKSPNADAQLREIDAWLGAHADERHSAPSQRVKQR
jgi:tetratricopeptide (TPR) repeat protein